MGEGDRTGRASAAAAAAGAPQEDAAPELLARAQWLAAEVALREHDLDRFHGNARAAVETLVAAGHDERAAALRDEWIQLSGRLLARRAVEVDGATGLLRVAAHQAWRLLARMRGELTWADIDRDRALLRELVAAPADERGTTQPLARLVRGLGLDPIETTLVVVVAGLAHVPGLAEAVRQLEGSEADGLGTELLVALAFAEPRARAVALARLAEGRPLRRFGVVRAAGDRGARVMLEPAVMWFLRGAPLADRPQPPGLTAHAIAPGSIEVDVLLGQALAQLERSLTAPRSAIALLDGPVGAGRRTVALAAAAAAGRPALVIDADRVPGEITDEVRRAAAREAMLHGAMLYLQLDDGDPGPWLGLADEAGLRLVIAVTPERAAATMTALRARRSDLVPVRFLPLAEPDLDLAWARVIAALGQTPPRAGLAALRRPGLVIGDLVETVTESMARADADGGPLTAERLGAVLGERTRAELEAVATPLPAAAGSPALPIQRWVERCLAVRGPVGAGGEPAAWRLAAVAGGPLRARLAAGAAAAARLGAPAWLVDLEVRDSREVEAALTAAGRAGALLVLAGVDRVAENPAIAEALDRRLGAVVLAVEALPTWLAARIDEVLELEAQR